MEDVKLPILPNDKGVLTFHNTVRESENSGTVELTGKVIGGPQNAQAVLDAALMACDLIYMGVATSREITITITTNYILELR